MSTRSMSMAVLNQVLVFLISNVEVISNSIVKQGRLNENHMFSILVQKSTVALIFLHPSSNMHCSILNFSGWMNGESVTEF